MKLFNPPELPELLIRCFIKDKQTKHVYKMSFIDTNLANCYNLIKEATKDIKESKSESCNIQIREFVNHIGGKSVSFNFPSSAIDVMYHLRERFGSE